MQMGDSSPREEQHVAIPKYKRSVPAQLGATMKRQFIQKKRMPCSACLEIFLPVFFILGLVLAARAADVKDNLAENYVVYNETVKQPTLMARQLMCYNSSNWASSDVPVEVTSMLPPCNFSQTSAKALGPPSLICDTNQVGDTSRFGLPVLGICVQANFFYSVTSMFGKFEDIHAVPQFDDLVLVQWGFRIAGEAMDFQQRVSGTSTVGSLYSSGKLWYVPDNADTRALANYLHDRFPLYKYVHGSFRNTYSEVLDNITSVQGEGKTWAVIRLDEQTTEKFTVTLSMNRSSIPWTNRIRMRFTGGLGRKSYSFYVSSGFVTLQEAVNGYYAHEVLNVSNDPRSQNTSGGTGGGGGASMMDDPYGYFFEDTTHVAVPMPTSAWRNSAFLSIAGSLSPLILVLSFLYSVSQLSKRLVEEKEQRLREGMFVMGLGKGSFYAGWILTYAVQAFITSVIITFLLKRNVMVESDPSIIFLVYFLFALSSITLASLFSTLFSKSRVSGIVTPLLYFAMVIPTFVVNAEDNRGAVLILSLLSPSAFSVAADLLFSYEVGQGLGWNDVGSTIDPINMATAMTFLAVDCVMYLVLTMYLDAVLPSEWGTRKHPLFFLGFGRKVKKAAGANPEDAEMSEPLLSGAAGSPTGKNNSPLSEMMSIDVQKFHARHSSGEKHSVESYPSEIGASSVHIHNLRKEFPAPSGKGDAKVAVDNFQLRLFPNHITALLGHNGAGKTTVANMLTGMLEISGGDCTIYGHSVVENVDKAREEIGFCPQHNILWDNLTCLEHLEYFAALKGVPSGDRRRQSLQLLQQVDLSEKTNTFSAKLSGGQKRKLSVAIAFIGGSRLILLDEPTAGMDVAARRHTWELLKQMSHGRTIVLTTHYMDEADLLGTKVAIMSQGKLHSYGSPMFLKSRLGYSLRVAMTPSITSAAAGTPLVNPVTESEVTAAIKKNCPQATLKEGKGGPSPAGSPIAQQQQQQAIELVYELPMDAAHKFPPTLRELEHMASGQLQLAMSVSTLEDVFLKIAQEEEGFGAAALAQEQSSAAVNVASDDIHQALNDCFGPRAPSRQDLHTSFGRQLPALLKKRFANSRRDRRTLCLQVFTPLVCITLAMLLALVGPPSNPRRELTTAMYDEDGRAAPPQMMSSAQCPGMEPYFSEDLVTNEVNSVNTLNFSSYLLDTAKTHGAGERYISISCRDDQWIMPPGASTIPGAATAPFTTYFTNASASHSLPQMVNEFHQAVVRRGVAAKMSGAGSASALDAANNIRMVMATEPLPFTLREESNIDGFVTLIVGFFILIPFTFIPSTFVSFIVKERSCKAKHQQLLSGVSLTAYWFSNLLFDLMSFFVTEAIAILIFVIFKRDEYIGSAEAFACIVLLFTLYGLSAIAASYALSFLFTNHGTAQNLVLLLNFIFGFVLVISAYIFKLIDSTKDIAKVLVFFFRLVPSYCLGEGILALAQAPMMEQLSGGGPENKIDLFEMDRTGWALVFMAINFVLFTTITAIIDSPARSKKRQQLLYDKNKVPDRAEDSEDGDVAHERAMVEKGTRTGDVVTVKHLSKEYVGSTGSGDPNDEKKKGTNKAAPTDRKIAVKDLSFGVVKGEVFGFLGTNGAGKTTTISILTGEQLPTTGVASIGGHDVFEEAEACRKLIGFCPQFDSVLDLLNAEEHLNMYAAIRGLPTATTSVKTVVDGLILACGLKEYRLTPSGQLSGGNKRKLGVAIALMGNPEVIILDEPSAGMDPVARRDMREVISHVAQQSSVILTTHHLEEIELLAHRVAIMVDGGMKCLGSLDHLKRKFGSGLELNVRVKAPALGAALLTANPNDIAAPTKAFIHQQFPSAQIVEERHGKITYNIPAGNALAAGGGAAGGKGNTSLASVFQVMLDAKSVSNQEGDTRSEGNGPDVGIEDFTVQQTSLEQVFLRISKEAADREELAKQEEERGVDRGDERADPGRIIATSQGPTNLYQLGGGDGGNSPTLAPPANPLTYGPTSDTTHAQSPWKQSSVPLTLAPAPLISSRSSRGGAASQLEAKPLSVRQHSGIASPDDGNASFGDTL